MKMPFQWYMRVHHGEKMGRESFYLYNQIYHTDLYPEMSLDFHNRNFCTEDTLLCWIGHQGLINTAYKFVEASTRILISNKR